MPFKSVSVTNTTVYTIAAAGRSDERVRLCGGVLTANTTTTLQFQTSTGNTALTGAMSMVAGVPLPFASVPGSPGSGRRPGYLETTAGDSLQIVLGTANTRVDGVLEFIYVAE